MTFLTNIYFRQVLTVRVSQKEPHFTGRMSKENVIEIKSNGFHVLIYKTHLVDNLPDINPGIQDALDSYDTFFLIQNKLCNWNPFNPVGTLRKLFSVVEPFCGNSTLCAITRYDYDAQMTKTNNTASKCFYFVCFPFIKGITIIKGIPKTDEKEVRIVYPHEGSLWEDVLKTVVEIWRKRWESVRRSKRQLQHLKHQEINSIDFEATEKGVQLLHDTEDIISSEIQVGWEKYKPTSKAQTSSTSQPSISFLLPLIISCIFTLPGFL